MSSRNTVAACLAIILTASVAGAEESGPLIISPQVIARAIASAPPGIPAATSQSTSTGQAASSRHIGRRVLWTSIGAAGGFFAGGYLGVWIENSVSPCGCDDAGLTGALIGAPIGAIAGGVTGFLLSK